MRILPTTWDSNSQVPSSFCNNVRQMEAHQICRESHASITRMNFSYKLPWALRVLVTWQPAKNVLTLSIKLCFINSKGQEWKVISFFLIFIIKTKKTWLKQNVHWKYTWRWFISQTSSLCCSSVVPPRASADKSTYF